MTARGPNVANLFPPASPAEREELLEIFGHFEAMDATQRAAVIAQFDQQIEAETNPAMKRAFAGFRDILAKMGAP
jgi:hypothetical protein